MKVNRYKLWVRQGRYRTEKGIKMVLVLTDKGTILEPLKKIKIYDSKRHKRA